MNSTIIITIDVNLRLFLLVCELISICYPLKQLRSLKITLFVFALCVSMR